jgi:hypothetical protein
MDRTERRRLGWRAGLVFVLLAIVVGTVVGVVVDRATGEPARSEPRAPQAAQRVMTT